MPVAHTHKHPAAATAGHGRRLEILDGWRAISIILVLACHLLPLGPARWRFNECAGPMGMALFFTLSGFLITTTLDRNPSVPAFLIRRGARILPLATVAMVAYLALQHKGFDYYVYHLSYTLNYHYAYFTELTSPFWSLCVEVHFYLAAALIVGLFGARGLLWLPVLGLAVTALRIATGTRIATETHLRVDEILAGATLALIWLGRLGSFGAGLERVLKAAPIPLLVLALIVTSHPLTGPLQYLRPYAGAALVGCTLFAPPRWQGALTSRAMRYIAEISYALYVLHPICRYGWLGTGGTLVRYAKRPIALALVVALAHLSTFYFESRWITWGKRWSRRWDRRAAATPAPHQPIGATIADASAPRF